MSDRSRAAGGKAAGKGGNGKGGKKAAAAGPEGEAPNPFAELSFEAALEQLEGIVDRLEEGDLDLAEALARFEDGVQLTRHCHTQLEAAEQRVDMLTREGGDWAVRPFVGTDDEDAEA